MLILLVLGPHWLRTKSVEKFLCLWFRNIHTWAIQSLEEPASFIMKMSTWAWSALSCLCPSKLTCVSSQARHLLCYSRGQKTSASTHGLLSTWLSGWRRLTSAPHRADWDRAARTSVCIRITWDAVLNALGPDLQRLISQVLVGA